MKALHKATLTAAVWISGSAVFAQNPTVTATVDLAQRRPISPLIYGVNFGSSGILSALNLTFNRQGGTPASRYNYKDNAYNTGNDWYFMSFPYSGSSEGGFVNGFVDSTKSAGAEAMVTMPTIDYIAKLGSGRRETWSFSISKYGQQNGSESNHPDAGTGYRSNGAPVLGNNPLDASIANTTTFQTPWLQKYLIPRNVKYYGLDNEPGIWHESHRDVHPIGAGMDEVVNKSIAFASLIRGLAPTAKILGPEDWNYFAVLYSGADLQWAQKNQIYDPNRYPDYVAHGKMYNLPYYLSKMQQYYATNGKRLIDFASIHYYPQGGEFDNSVSTTMQKTRNRSTRSLWDPTYKDATWVNDYIALIPRMRSWNNTFFPGTRIALTEYNWGAENHINGATTQADILGIFGREGVDIAARWLAPANANNAVANSFKMYRNYDGLKSTFGDQSNGTVAVSGANLDDVSVFSANRSKDGAVTVMVVAKRLTGSTPVKIALNHPLIATGAAYGKAKVWQMKAGANATTTAIAALPEVASASGFYSLTVPPQSVTLLVIAPTTTSPVRSAVVSFSNLPANRAAQFGKTHRIVIRKVGDATKTEVHSLPLPDDSDQLTVKSSLRGVFDIAIEVPGFLRRVLRNISLGTNDVNLPTVTLINGDVNGDNRIDVTDRNLVNSALGSKPGMTTWNPAADLNGDGKINTVDLQVVATNINKIGDN